MKIKRWLKIGLLLCLPVSLLLLIAERRSWRPAVRRVAGKPFQVAFSPDGKRLAIAFHDTWSNHKSGVELWDVQAPTSLAQPQVEVRQKLLAPYLGSIAFAPLEPTLAGLAYSGAKIWLWNLPDGRLKRTLAAENGGGQYLHFWPRFDVLTYYDGVETIQQSLRTGKIMRRMNRATLFSPDGKTVARDSHDDYGNMSDDIVFWDVRQGRRQGTLRRGACGENNLCTRNAGTFSGDGTLLAISYTRQDDKGAESHSFGLWDVPRAQLRFSRANLKVAMTAFAFSPDGRLLAGCDGGEIVRIWNVSAGQIVRELQHRGPIASLAFAPDNRTLATATSGGTISLWRVR